MFGQIQEQLLTDRVSCHSPNWVSCDGIDLAEGVRVSENRDSDPPLNDHVPIKDMTAPGRLATWVILKQDFRIRCLKRSIPTRFTPRLKANATVQWVKPKLVCEVAFQEWTSDGKMRAPSFLGLRDDKEPKEVVREI